MFVHRVCLLSVLYVRVHIYVNLFGLFFGAGRDRFGPSSRRVSKITLFRSLKRVQINVYGTRREFT